MRVLDSALDDHDRVVQTPLDLGNELVGSTPQDHRARLGLGATLKEVEPLASNLLLLKLSASTEVLLLDIATGRLDRTSDGLDDSSEIVRRNSTGAEDVAVGKVLGSEITNGKLGKDDFGTGSDDGLELLVDDGPLGINDGLVLLQERYTKDEERSVCDFC